MPNYIDLPLMLALKYPEDKMPIYQGNLNIAIRLEILAYVYLIHTEVTNITLITGDLWMKFGVFKLLL